MKPEGPLAYSQEPASGPNSELDYSWFSSLPPVHIPNTYF